MQAARTLSAAGAPLGDGRTLLDLRIANQQRVADPSSTSCGSQRSALRERNVLEEADAIRPASGQYELWSSGHALTSIGGFAGMPGWVAGELSSRGGGMWMPFFRQVGVRRTGQEAFLNSDQVGQASSLSRVRARCSHLAKRSWCETGKKVRAGELALDLHDYFTV
ncbi:MAG: hypothetical protein H6914_00275 [Novosphingobium sp.]|nr:hypothetical protein [Novosphingobium sp.]